MSAWIVSKTHIDVLVTALVAWEFILPEQASETGSMLWQENVKSIHARYPDTVADRDYPGPIDFRKAHADQYKFEGIAGRIDPWCVERASGCYDYQTCEHGGYYDSVAHDLVSRLRDHAERMMPEFDERFGSIGSPGFGTAAGAWGYDSRDVFASAEQLRAVGVSA